MSDIIVEGFWVFPLHHIRKGMNHSLCDHKLCHQGYLASMSFGCGNIVNILRARDTPMPAVWYRLTEGTELGGQMKQEERTKQRCLSMEMSPLAIIRNIAG